MYDRWLCMILRVCIGSMYKTFLTMCTVLQQILAILQRSTAIPPEIVDTKLRFWTAYQIVAEEFDDEFLEKYNTDMDTAMIFVGFAFT